MRELPKKSIVSPLGLEIKMEDLPEDFDFSPYQLINLETPIGKFPLYEVKYNFKRNTMSLEFDVNQKDMEYFQNHTLRINLGTGSSLYINPIEHTPLLCKNCNNWNNSCDNEFVKFKKHPGEDFYCSFWRNR